MKKVNLKKNLALILCSVAISVATASTGMCLSWWFNECKMPESLYKVD